MKQKTLATITTILILTLLFTSLATAYIPRATPQETPNKILPTNTVTGKAGIDLETEMAKRQVEDVQENDYITINTVDNNLNGKHKVTAAQDTDGDGWIDTITTQLVDINGNPRSGASNTRTITLYDVTYADGFTVASADGTRTSSHSQTSTYTGPSTSNQPVRAAEARANSDTTRSAPPSTPATNPSIIQPTSPEALPDLFAVQWADGIVGVATRDSTDTNKFNIYNNKGKLVQTRTAQEIQDMPASGISLHTITPGQTDNENMNTVTIPGDTSRSNFGKLRITSNTDGTYNLVQDNTFSNPVLARGRTSSGSTAAQPDNVAPESIPAPAPQQTLSNNPITPALPVADGTSQPAQPVADSTGGVAGASSATNAARTGTTTDESVDATSDNSATIPPTRRTSINVPADDIPLMANSLTTIVDLPPDTRIFYGTISTDPYTLEQTPSMQAPIIFVKNPDGSITAYDSNGDRYLQAESHPEDITPIKPIQQSSDIPADLASTWRQAGYIVQSTSNGQPQLIYDSWGRDNVLIGTIPDSTTSTSVATTGSETVTSTNPSDTATSIQQTRTAPTSQPEPPLAVTDNAPATNEQPPRPGRTSMLVDSDSVLPDYSGGTTTVDLPEPLPANVALHPSLLGGDSGMYVKVEGSLVRSDGGDVYIQKQEDGTYKIKSYNRGWPLGSDTELATFTVYPSGTLLYDSGEENVRNIMGSQVDWDTFNQELGNALSTTNIISVPGSSSNRYDIALTGVRPPLPPSPSPPSTPQTNTGTTNAESGTTSTSRRTTSPSLSDAEIRRMTDEEFETYINNQFTPLLAPPSASISAPGTGTTTTSPQTVTTTIQNALRARGQDLVLTQDTQDLVASYLETRQSRGDTVDPAIIQQTKVAPTSRPEPNPATPTINEPTLTAPERAAAAGRARLLDALHATTIPELQQIQEIDIAGGLSFANRKISLAQPDGTPQEYTITGAKLDANGKPLITVKDTTGDTLEFAPDNTEQASTRPNIAWQLGAGLTRFVANIPFIGEALPNAQDITWDASRTYTQITPPTPPLASSGAPPVDTVAGVTPVPAPARSLGEIVIAGITPGQYVTLTDTPNKNGAYKVTSVEDTNGDGTPDQVIAQPIDDNGNILPGPTTVQVQITPQDIETAEIRIEDVYPAQTPSTPVAASRTRAQIITDTLASTTATDNTKVQTLRFNLGKITQNRETLDPALEQRVRDFLTGVQTTSTIDTAKTTATQLLNNNLKVGGPAVGVAVHVTAGAGGSTNPAATPADTPPATQPGAQAGAPDTPTTGTALETDAAALTNALTPPGQGAVPDVAFETTADTSVDAASTDAPTGTTIEESVETPGSGTATPKRTSMPAPAGGTPASVTSPTTLVDLSPNVPAFTITQSGRTTQLIHDGTNTGITLTPANTRDGIVQSYYARDAQGNELDGIFFVETDGTLRANPNAVSSVYNTRAASIINHPDLPDPTRAIQLGDLFTTAPTDIALDPVVIGTSRQILQSDTTPLAATALARLPESRPPTMTLIDQWFGNGESDIQVNGQTLTGTDGATYYVSDKPSLGWLEIVRENPDGTIMPFAKVNAQGLSALPWASDPSHTVQEQNVETAAFTQLLERQNIDIQSFASGLSRVKDNLGDNTLPVTVTAIPTARDTGVVARGTSTGTIPPAEGGTVGADGTVAEPVVATGGTATPKTSFTTSTFRGLTRGRTVKIQTASGQVDAQVTNLQYVSGSPAYVLTLPGGNTVTVTPATEAQYAVPSATTTLASGGPSAGTITPLLAPADPAAPAAPLAGSLPAASNPATPQLTPQQIAAAKFSSPALSNAFANNSVRTITIRPAGAKTDQTLLVVDRDLDGDRPLLTVRDTSTNQEYTLTPDNTQQASDPRNVARRWSAAATRLVADTPFIGEALPEARDITWDAPITYAQANLVSAGNLADERYVRELIDGGVDIPDVPWDDYPDAIRNRFQHDINTHYATEAQKIRDTPGLTAGQKAEQLNTLLATAPIQLSMTSGINTLVQNTLQEAVKPTSGATREQFLAAVSAMSKLNPGGTLTSPGAPSANLVADALKKADAASGITATEAISFGSFIEDHPEVLTDPRVQALADNVIQRSPQVNDAQKGNVARLTTALNKAQAPPIIQAMQATQTPVSDAEVNQQVTEIATFWKSSMGRELNATEKQDLTQSLRTTPDRQVTDKELTDLAEYIKANPYTLDNPVVRDAFDAMIANVKRTSHNEKTLNDIFNYLPLSDKRDYNRLETLSSATASNPLTSAEQNELITLAASLDPRFIPDTQRDNIKTKLAGIQTTGVQASLATDTTTQLNRLVAQQNKLPAETIPLLNKLASNDLQLTAAEKAQLDTLIQAGELSSADNAKYKITPEQENALLDAYFAVQSAETEQIYSRQAAAMALQGLGLDTSLQDGQTEGATNVQVTYTNSTGGTQIATVTADNFVNAPLDATTNQRTFTTTTGTTVTIQEGRYTTQARNASGGVITQNYANVGPSTPVNVAGFKQREFVITENGAEQRGMLLSVADDGTMTFILQDGTTKTTFADNALIRTRAVEDTSRQSSAKDYFNAYAVQQFDATKLSSASAELLALITPEITRGKVDFFGMTGEYIDPATGEIKYQELANALSSQSATSDGFAIAGGKIRTGNVGSTTGATYILRDDGGLIIAAPPTTQGGSPTITNTDIHQFGAQQLNTWLKTPTNIFGGNRNATNFRAFIAQNANSLDYTSLLTLNTNDIGLAGDLNTKLSSDENVQYRNGNVARMSATSNTGFYTVGTDGSVTAQTFDPGTRTFTDLPPLTAHQTRFFLQADSNTNKGLNNLATAQQQLTNVDQTVRNKDAHKLDNTANTLKLEYDAANTALIQAQAQLQNAMNAARSAQTVGQTMPSFNLETVTEDDLRNVPMTPTTHASVVAAIRARDAAKKEKADIEARNEQAIQDAITTKKASIGEGIQQEGRRLASAAADRFATSFVHEQVGALATENIHMDDSARLLPTSGNSRSAQIILGMSENDVGEQTRVKASGGGDTALSVFSLGLGQFDPVMTLHDTQTGTTVVQEFDRGSIDDNKLIREATSGSDRVLVTGRNKNGTYNFRKLDGTTGTIPANSAIVVRPNENAINEERFIRNGQRIGRTTLETRTINGKPERVRTGGYYTYANNNADTPPTNFRVFAADNNKPLDVPVIPVHDKFSGTRQLLQVGTSGNIRYVYDPAGDTFLRVNSQGTYLDKDGGEITSSGDVTADLTAATASDTEVTQLRNATENLDQITRAAAETTSGRMGRGFIDNFMQEAKQAFRGGLLSGLNYVSGDLIAGYDHFKGLSQIGSLFIDQEHADKRRKQMMDKLCDNFKITSTECIVKEICTVYLDNYVIGSTIGSAGDPEKWTGTGTYIAATKSRPVQYFNATTNLNITEWIYRVQLRLKAPADQDIHYNLVWTDKQGRTYSWWTKNGISEDKIVKAGGSVSITGANSVITYKKGDYTRVCLVTSPQLRNYDNKPIGQFCRTFEDTGGPTTGYGQPGSGTGTAGQQTGAVLEGITMP